MSSSENGSGDSSSSSSDSDNSSSDVEEHHQPTFRNARAEYGGDGCHKDEDYSGVDSDREIYRASDEAPCDSADVDDGDSDNDGDCSDDDDAAAEITAAGAAGAHGGDGEVQEDGGAEPSSAPGKRKRKARITVNLDMCDYTVITKVLQSAP
jgi:hypothetical protein